MSDTPETDELSKGEHIAHPTVWAFCRKFERERDEALADLEFRRDLYKLQSERLEGIERERDEAIEMMKRTRDNSGEIIASQANENIILTQQRDIYWEQADYFLERLSRTQEKMYDAERKLEKISEALECILGIGLTGKTEAKAKKALQNND